MGWTGTIGIGTIGWMGIFVVLARLELLLALKTGAGGKGSGRGIGIKGGSKSQGCGHPVTMHPQDDSQM